MKGLGVLREPVQIPKYDNPYYRDPKMVPLFGETPIWGRVNLTCSHQDSKCRGPLAHAWIGGARVPQKSLQLIMQVLLSYS